FSRDWSSDVCSSDLSLSCMAKPWPLAPNSGITVRMMLATAALSSGRIFRIVIRVKVQTSSAIYPILSSKNTNPMRTLTGFLFLLITLSATAQLTELTVEKIMRDPKWIGTSPSNIRWSHDSKTIYFNWNPENAPGDSLYKITLQNRTPQKVSKA